jgi:predicted metal-binding membrane protein
MALAPPVGRFAVIAALLAAITLSWAYLAAMAGHGMGATHGPAAWSVPYAAAMLLMMVAMMLPSAVPMIVLMDRLVRGRQGAGRDTALFASGYVVVWAGFGAFATLAQWALHAAGGLTADLRLVSPTLAAVVFIAAGAYQFAPLKGSCLVACRSPLAFLTRYWRAGPDGALRMGLHHGLLCLGCCWLLMTLLFVGGAMSLLWIVPLALFVLVEKYLPGGERVGRAAGALLIIWGAAVLLMNT